jgi:hypothetical protein
MVCTLWNLTIVKGAADLRQQEHQIKDTQVENAVLRNGGVVGELQHKFVAYSGCKDLS